MAPRLVLRPVQDLLSQSWVAVVDAAVMVSGAQCSGPAVVDIAFCWNVWTLSSDGCARLGPRRILTRMLILERHPSLLVQRLHSVSEVDDLSNGE